MFESNWEYVTTMATIDEKNYKGWKYVYEVCTMGFAKMCHLVQKIYEQVYNNGIRHVSIMVYLYTRRNYVPCN
jgi:lipocalin